MALGNNKYEPWSVAEEVSKALQLSTWRRKIADDPHAARWQHLFEKIEPHREIIKEGTANMMAVTSGSVSPHYLYGLMLAMWTYGAADMASMLADEEVTLWEGKPLEGFPDWDNEAPEPPPEGPDSLPPPDKRSLVMPAATEQAPLVAAVSTAIVRSESDGGTNAASYAG